MRVDLHTHILPPGWPDLQARFGGHGWPKLDIGADQSGRIMIDGRCFRDITANSWDPRVRLEECRSAKIDVQVLSTVPVMFSYWAPGEQAYTLCRYLNDHLASVVTDHPQHFVALGTLPLQSPELAVRELERCMGELGMAGIEIGTHVNDWNLDEPALFPVFEAAEKLGAAVFVHPWDMMAKERMPRYFLPWLVGMPAETALAMASLIFGGVLDKLPGLRIAFAHGGGAFPYTLGRMDRGFVSRPDLCATHISNPPSTYMSKVYVDSLVHDVKALRYLIEVFGRERVALGSDYPFPLGEACPGALIEKMALDRATQDWLLGGAALSFLGLNESLRRMTQAVA